MISESMIFQTLYPSTLNGKESGIISSHKLQCTYVHTYNCIGKPELSTLV